MFNKKGINPLIATMLLVALAVAIGTSFVSYAGVYFQSKLLKDEGCKSYFVDFFELNRQKSICASQLNAPFALKFEHGNKQAMKTECYVSIASGTGQLCNAKAIFFNNTWIISENIKI